MSNDLLDLSAQIQAPGGWLDLEDEANGYWLHNESFKQSSVTHRKTDISSEWVEGSFTTRGVRENVVEQVSVYVQGATPYQLQTRLKALTDALEQLTFQMVVRFGDSQQTWTCEMADYTVVTQQEYRFATMALVQANVPRLPGAALIQVSA